MGEHDLVEMTAADAERYREIASEMLRRANAGRSSGMRCMYLMMAMDWKALADHTDGFAVGNRARESFRPGLGARVLGLKAQAMGFQQAAGARFRVPKAPGLGPPSQTRGEWPDGHRHSLPYGT